jgi:class 3 adenylate cyclase
MEPSIQFAKTSDGVSIAFWELGNGPALIYMPPTPRHVHLDWQHSEARQLYEWLASQHRLIRLDARNTGFSDRGVRDVSLEARQLDIKAVCERLQLDNLVVFGHGGSASTAIGFAALNPDRVSRLILADATVGFSDVPEPDAVQALRGLVTRDWEAYTETMAKLMGGWSAGGGTPSFASLLRDSQDWADAQHHLSTPVYASQMLTRVRAPTMVVHHDNAIVTTLETGRHIAAQITGSRLVPLDGTAIVSSESDPKMIEVVDDFLVGIAGQVDNATGRSSTKTILFADIVDSTALTEELGNAEFHSLARYVEGLTLGIIRSHAGVAIEGKTLGDGVLATFLSAHEAIAAGLGLSEVGASSKLHLHIGIHAGDVIEETDLYGRSNISGGAVNIAARICAVSAADEVLITGVVRSLAYTSATATFDDRGEREFKGVTDPQRLFAVHAIRE